MEKELIFQILGIKETREEEKIRTAYRMLLKNTNPEDNPEGFKRLRQAYEEALELTRKSNELTEEEPKKDEVELWIDRLGEFYENLPLRHNLETWKSLLSDPVCEELDTSLEAKEKLLEFLMNHEHLPHTVWKLIDSTFRIVEDIENLSQQFPINFLNYIKYYVENETFLPYEWFTYRDPEQKAINGDAYINGYLTLRDQITNDEKIETCLQSLEDLSAYGIYHPFEDVERLRLLVKKGETDKSLPLACDLIEKYPDNPYIQFHVAEAKWNAGEKTQAYEIWENILEQNPDHYMAKYNIVQYLMENKDYYEAREKMFELLDVYEDKKVIELLKTANDVLIPEFQGKLERGESDPHFPGDELRLELVWCLFQNERLEEAAKLLEDFHPEKEQEYTYYNVYGRLLYQLEQCEKALPYLQKWLSMIQEMTDDGTKKTRQRLSRLGTANYILGCCYYGLGKQQEAEDSLHEAIRTISNPRERLQCMQYLANVYLWSKQYEKAIDASDKLINESNQYYPAYLIRQEAYYELGMGQEVINNYHEAVDIFPGFYQPYLYAIQVFFHSSQYEDAQNVLTRARENQVEFSSRMKLYEAKILRNLANNKEERKAPRKILEELKQELEKEDCDIKDKSEIDFEIGLLYWDDNELEQALTLLKKAIEQNPDRLQYRMVCGGIYLDMKQYKEALKEYEAGEKAYQNTAWLYYNRGLCYEGMELRDMAAQNYKKALEIEKDGYRAAAYKLSQYYHENYDKTFKKEDFDRSIEFINKQLAFTDSSYYLIERGRIYLNASEFEPAIRDFEKALEYAPNGWALNNLGCCYEHMGQFDKAIEYFKKALEVMGEDDDPIPYTNIANCYQAKRDYQTAIDYLKKNIERFPKYSYLSYLWERIGDLYFYLGQYKEALDAYEKTKDRDKYYQNIGDVWFRKGEKRKCIQFYVKAIKKADKEEKSDKVSSLGYLYLATFMDYKKAISCFKKAISLTTDSYDLFNYERHLARSYYMIGKYEEAKKHGEASLAHFRNSEHGTLEDYLAYKPYRPARMASIAWIYLCLGQREKAIAYLSDMEKMDRCETCKHQECFEGRLYLGDLYKSEKDIKKALEQYNIALERNPQCDEARLAIKNLQEMKG